MSFVQIEHFTVEAPFIEMMAGKRKLPALYYPSKLNLGPPLLDRSGDVSQ
jgi:hypothetical protein